MSYSSITVTPEQPNIGATISDVDLNNPSSPIVYEEIREALLEHGVVFFRDQNLTPEAHVKLANALGLPETHEFFPSVPNHKQISIISMDDNVDKEIGQNGTDRWHADVTFRPDPSFASILRGVDIPFGGDTMWVNMNAAYESLPAKIKTLLEGLDADHDGLADAQLRAYILEQKGPDGLAEFAKHRPPHKHPVVIAHPLTGKPILYVNSIWTQRLNGLPEDLAQSVLSWLFELPKVPEFQVRFKWEPNSVVIWDNFLTQHYAVNDYKDYREMQRVVISGYEPRAYNHTTSSLGQSPSFLDGSKVERMDIQQQTAIKQLFASV